MNRIPHFFRVPTEIFKRQLCYIAHIHQKAQTAQIMEKPKAPKG